MGNTCKAYVDTTDHSLVVIGYAPKPFTTTQFLQWVEEQVSRLNLNGWGWIDENRAIPSSWKEITLPLPF